MANPHLYVRYQPEVSRVWIYLILLGCYAPRELPTGSPCSVAAPTCPEGQNCIRVDGAFQCESMAPADAGGGGGHDGPPGTQRLRYEATASGCVSEMYGQELCLDLYGGDGLVVTSADDFTMMPLAAYLRFDLDGAFVGKTVAAVTLELTAQDTAMAASDASGAVWRANVFTQSSLDTISPGTIGAMIAGDPGAIATHASVDWDVSDLIVTPGAPVCLAVQSMSTNLAIYENHTSATPPVLLVDVY